MLSIYVILLNENNQIHSEPIFIVSFLEAKLNNELTIFRHQVTNESSTDRTIMLYPRAAHDDQSRIPDPRTMTNLDSNFNLDGWLWLK